MKKVFSLLLFFVTVFVMPLTVYAFEDIGFCELCENNQSSKLTVYHNTSVDTLLLKEGTEKRFLALDEEREFFVFEYFLSNREIKTMYAYFAEINRNDLAIIIIILLIILVVIALLGLVIINKKSKSIKENERFKALHDISFGGLVIHEQGIILDCNKGLFDLTGYNYEELIGMENVLLIAPEQRNFVMSQFESGYELSYETKGIRKNGDIYPLRIESKNASYKGKDVLITEFRDITKIKKIEEENIKLEMQWSKLIREMPLGFSLKEMVWDEKGNPIDFRFLDINYAYQVMTGLKREDIIGKRATKVFPKMDTIWIERYAPLVLKKETVVIEDYSKALKKYFKVISYPFIDSKFIVIVEDISARKLQEKALIEKENEKSRIINNLPGIYYKCKLDNDWTILYVSEYCERITGYKPVELINNKELSFNDLIIPKYRNYLLKSWAESKRFNRTNTVEYEIIKKDGTKAWIGEKGKAFIRNGEWFIEGFLMDITEQKHNEEKVVYASNHDFLTGLPNKRYFNEKLKEFDKPENYPLLIAMVDIDGLKLINDTYGHLVGDETIKKVANLLREFYPEPAIISRDSGDEFLILLPKTTTEKYKQKRNSLFERISETKIKEIQLSLSFGSAIKTNQSIDITDVITEAENNMYSNKVLHSQSSRNQTINAIFNLLKEKYDEEKEHSDRVSHYCVLMGEKLNLTENEKLELEFAGRMHDIGKITIPDYILKKPGELTLEEWEIMKAHTTNGYQILRSADKYSKLAEYALTHHERIDGKGYPLGLKGDDIPLFSRIISICDAYEAMTSNRPYRKALGREFAINELKRCAGTQFDKKLVDVFINEVLVNE